jgi:hypothetical protein
MTRRRVLSLVSGAVLAAGLAVGAAGFRTDLLAAFGKESSSRIVTPELAARVRYVRSRVPSGAEILYVSSGAATDAWQSRLWQRVLYPARVVIVEADALPPAVPGKSARFALAAGPPPAGLRFRWRVAFRPLPGETETLWFGELPP